MTSTASQCNVRSTLSPADKYRKEWEDLLSSIHSDLSGLRNSAFSGDLKTSKFRSVCWSLLLRVISDLPSNWTEQKKQQRQKYNTLKEEFICNPHKGGSLSDDDPLSQSKQSAWNQYFGDQELFSLIKQDVIRTFPGVEFFRKPQIQETMINILFYYAREHPYMCYRQGMHEILAPVLFVMHCDHQSLQHFVEVSDDINEILLDILDPAYLEADSYCIFSRLMTSIESYYRIVNLMPTAEGYFPVQTEACDDIASTEVEVIRQLNFIRDKILAKEDLHLHNYLLKMDIPLHIFGIRWLRLLFGREFPLQDLLILWDAIFSDSDRFELPNYILVAMLIRIRDKLLLSDYTTCLTYLMRYPNNLDINLILRHALYMYMPKKYERPSDAFIYVTPKTVPTSLPRYKLHNTLPRQNSSPKSYQSPPKYKSVERTTQRTRSSSCTGEDLSSQNSLRSLKSTEHQYRNAVQAAHMANRTGIPASDAFIVDGYRSDNSHVLRLELQNAQTVMAITRLKLKKYVTILRAQTQSEEASQALDGIEELCAFLDVKLQIPNSAALPYPIDQALEADEGCQPRRNAPCASGCDSTPVQTANTDKLREANIFEPAPISSNEIGENVKLIEDSPSLETVQSNSSSETKSRTRYEIPENMSNRLRALGTRQDVEMKLFKEERLNDHDLGGVPVPDPLGLREN